MDPSHEQEENRDLRPLAAVESGGATIVRLAEHDGDLLHWFYEQGLVPGTEVEVMRADPAAGQLTIADRRRRARDRRPRGRRPVRPPGLIAPIAPRRTGR